MTGLDQRIVAARRHLGAIKDNHYLSEVEVVALKMAVLSILDFLEDRFAPTTAIDDDRKSTPVETFNRFFACETVTEVISQAVGAGSECWFDRKIDIENGLGHRVERVFDSEEAMRIADEAEAQIKVILDRQAAKLAPRDMKPGLGSFIEVDKSQIPPYTINKAQDADINRPDDYYTPPGVNRDQEYLYGAFGLDIPRGKGGHETTEGFNNV